MATAFHVLIIVHTIVAALIMAGYVLSMNAPRVHSLMLWSLRAQLLLGLILTGMGSAGAADEKLNHLWVAAKLLIALGAVGCAEAANAKARKGAHNPMLVHAAVGLALLNVVVAYAFR